MASDQIAGLVGGAYILIGLVGFVCNTATVLMIVTNRVYRLSAYTMMANVAFADAIMMLVAGVVCGSLIVWPSTSTTLPQNLQLELTLPDVLTQAHNATVSSQPAAGLVSDLTEGLPSRERRHLLTFNSEKGIDQLQSDSSSTYQLPSDPSSTYQLPSDPSSSPGEEDARSSAIVVALSLFEIAAWTAGVVSYAFLGLNRCVAICFYGTKAKSLNRVSVALFASAVTWAIGIVTACVGTIPDPLMGIRHDMWTISFLHLDGNRPVAFIAIASVFNVVSVVAQWWCSVLVLLKIRQVRHKINKNMLNVHSANRFRKQARLTFQFFYPSLLCTVSSIVYFAKPFMTELLSEWQFVLLHTVWLCNHMCNPFIYAYFNERMRNSYQNWLSCAALRYLISKKRKQLGFVGRRRLNVSSRSFGGAGHRGNQTSMRSGRTTRDGNFVRNSLQMQSRDFEQLCEFMVRVNPLYDSSEGWRESSDEDEEEQPSVVETRSAPIDVHMLQEPRSLMRGLGRQTVQQWARFARKASM